MTARMVRCPQCGKSVEYRTDNPSRPFCTPRCKLIDLGAWAEERYAITSPAGLSSESSMEDGLETRREPDPSKLRPTGN